jgi:acetyl-CoA carboxylase beta subunit
MIGSCIPYVPDGILLTGSRIFTRKPIYIYEDNTNDLIVMYLIIRCPSCRTFTYVDRFQKWKLCPICGHAHEVVKAPAYLEVEHYLEAEHIVKQMEKHLHTTKKPDFSPEETAELRHHYTEALRKRARGRHTH